MEFDRSEVFAPTKNPTGVDSAESCRQMLIDRDIRRLEAAGVVVPRKANGEPDVMVEISPELVLDADDVLSLVSSRKIELIRGQKVVIE